MGPGNGFSRGPQNELFSARRPPTGTPADGNSTRAPYSTRRRAEKSDIASFQSPPGFARKMGIGSLLDRFRPFQYLAFCGYGGRACRQRGWPPQDPTMPGAGTDKTKAWIVQAGPIVVLVEPQLGENIGAAARVMANFGLARLRLVKPRDGWPNLQARRSASGADRVLDEAVLYDDVAAAIADCNFVLATTARAHDQAKPVLSPEVAVREIADHMAGDAGADGGAKVAILFGRERYGLENAEVAL